MSIVADSIDSEKDMDDVKLDLEQQPVVAYITRIEYEDPSSTSTEVEENENYTDTDENPYASWTRQELKEGIEEVQAEIRDLQNELAEEAECKRQQFRAVIMDGIENVKAQLQVLGVEIEVPKKGSDGKSRVREGKKKGKKGKREKWY